MASRLNQQLNESVRSRSAEEQYDSFARNERKRVENLKEYEMFRVDISAKSNEKILAEEMSRLDKTSKRYRELEEEHKRVVDENNQKAYEAAIQFEQVKYERALDLDKKRINEDRLKRLQAEKEESEMRSETIKRLMELEGRSQDEIDAAIEKEGETRKRIQKEINETRTRSFDVEKKVQDEIIKKAKSWNREDRKSAKEAIEKEYKERLGRLEELKKKKDEDRTEEDNKEIENLEKLNKEARGAIRKAGALDYVDTVLDSVINKVGENISKGLSDIDASINSYYAAQGSIEARLQGSGESYKQMTKLVSQSIGLSGYVSQKKVLENIKTLVEAGISYNVEQRAFLATISENIASTFDAANGTLLRLIRLQQADSTQARLGMEASLTNFLNRMYSDTSYLNDLYDNVSAAIIDANSQLTRNQSVEFEYAIQKWLGSLASLGMSGEAITNIATGINYLATGNVGALSSNQGLNTLLAMSAGRAGISYASALTGGLTAEDTNDLLMSMVEYLKEIAGNQNKVVQSAYAGMYGMSLADLRAISSLTGTEMNTIYGTSMTYGGATKELKNQINQISNRVHLSTVLQTVYENFVGSVASDIGSSTGKYLTWMIADLLENTVGGIPLPTVTVFGSGVDLNTSVAQLMKLGMVGYSTISQLGSLLYAASQGPNLALSEFGFDATTRRSRGQGFVGVAKGAQRTSSASITQAVGSGLEESDVESMTEESRSKAKESVKSEEPKEGESIKDIWNALMSVIGDDAEKSMKVTIVNSELPVNVRNWDEKPQWYNSFE